ncbi:hypothetical protein GB2207_11003 [marine gamma proteobacterium HTCC2207]|uniref:TonB C-terminal domain-containing protein n=1 Tax=gamma proteobacterium HTCC2207 TaxID=314287 RepID=Q1YSR6_9GAMM|nr:hypothetical protein GB2207_11003 [marine gamma proteobacterium HTCC2207] [gamma proteobacterium HTCC2207]
MDIQGTAAGDAAIVRKVSETVTTAKEPSKNLVSQPSKWLKRLFKGMAIMTALGLTSLAAAQSNLVMNGSSVYADLGKDQFAAALYLETQQQNPGITHSMQGQKRMEVRVLNNYSKRRWFNLWMQSISINNSRETFSDSAQDLITLMQAPKSAPKRGDFIEYLSSPDRGTSMRFNGTELVAGLPSEVFALLLNTWIGAIPPTTSFKNEILGKQSNPEAVALLKTVTTDPQRVSLAASWILPPEPAAVAERLTERATTVKSVISVNPKAKLAAVATTANIGTKPIATQGQSEEQNKEQSAAVKLIADSDNAGSKSGSLAKASVETVAADSEINADIEDEVDFSITEALAMRDYTPLVVQKIYKKISYPSRAIDRGLEGTVRMSIVVSKSGALKKVIVAQKSRHSILNKAAIKATERAAPFPELPAALNTDHFEITVPITFKLK